MITHCGVFIQVLVLVIAVLEVLVKFGVGTIFHNSYGH